MTSINLFSLLNNETSVNAGIRAELAYAKLCGTKDPKFDHVDYDKGSDVEVGSRHISVKSSRFSLMSGNLCEGRTTFDAIWELYKTRVASNEWTYITQDGIAYEMNFSEFETFVYKFCTLDTESAKNGGLKKIRCRKESKTMLRWLESRA